MYVYLYIHTYILYILKHTFTHKNRIYICVHVKVIFKSILMLNIQHYLYILYLYINNIQHYLYILYLYRYEYRIYIYLHVKVILKSILMFFFPSM